MDAIAQRQIGELLFLQFSKVVFCILCGLTASVSGIEGFASCNFGLHRFKGLPVDDRLMIPSHKILGQFAAIEELLLLDMIVGEEFLQEQIPGIFFVSEHHHDHTRIPKSALRRGDTFGNQCFHNSHTAHAIQIHAEDTPNNLCLFRYDGENTVSDLVTVHLEARGNTLLKLLSNTPLAVFRYVPAFFLKKRSEDREHQLSVPAHGINLLFLKVNAYAHLLENTHRFQQRDRISGKT